MLHSSYHDQESDNYVVPHNPFFGMPRCLSVAHYFHFGQNGICGLPNPCRHNQSKLRALGKPDKNHETAQTVVLYSCKLDLARKRFFLCHDFAFSYNCPFQSIYRHYPPHTIFNMSASVVLKAWEQCNLTDTVFVLVCTVFCWPIIPAVGLAYSGYSHKRNGMASFMPAILSIGVCKEHRGSKISYSKSFHE